MVNATTLPDVGFIYTFLLITQLFPDYCGKSCVGPTKIIYDLLSYLYLMIHNCNLNTT